MSSFEAAQVRVDRLTSADVSDAAIALADAFSEDPYTTGLLPKGDGDAQLRTVFRCLMQEILTQGQESLIARNKATGETLGAALWLAPDAPSASKAFIRNLPTYFRLFRHRSPAVALTRFIEHLHFPKHPTWYLSAIGTTHAARGKGIGAMLMQPKVDQASAHGQMMYLEAASAEVVPFYERFGFEFQRRIPAIGTVSTYGMLRH